MNNFLFDLKKGTSYLFLYRLLIFNLDTLNRIPRIPTALSMQCSCAIFRNSFYSHSPHCGARFGPVSSRMGCIACKAQRAPRAKDCDRNRSPNLETSAAPSPIRATCDKHPPADSL